MSDVVRITTLHVELAEDEAEVLCALLGGVEYTDDSKRFLQDLFFQLRDALPERQQAFSDLFEGEVRAK